MGSSSALEPHIPPRPSIPRSLRLYLLRHGIAEDRHPDGDAARTLTAQGIAKMQLQAAAFRHLDLGLDRVLSSPYDRARQTARLVAEALGVPVEEHAALRAGCHFDDLAGVIEAAGRPETALVVGHQPDLGEIVYALTGASVKVRKGTLVALDAPGLRRGRGSLRGLYDPDAVARLGAALRP